MKNIDLLLLLLANSDDDIFVFVQLVLSEVRSKAIIKYASIETPARFQELQANTNLNNPPSNWLHGRSKWESYIQNASLCRGTLTFFEVCAW
jgi:hypothetical protein